MPHSLDVVAVLLGTELADDEALALAAGKIRTPFHLVEKPTIKRGVKDILLVDVVMSPVNARDIVHVFGSPFYGMPVREWGGVGGQQCDVEVAAGDLFVKQAMYFLKVLQIVDHRSPAIQAEFVGHAVVVDPVETFCGFHVFEIVDHPGHVVTFILEIFNGLGTPGGKIHFGIRALHHL